MAIPLKAVQRAAQECGGVCKGDNYVMASWSQHYGSEQSMTPPFLSREELYWPIDQGTRILGMATTGA